MNTKTPKKTMPPKAAWRKFTRHPLPGDWYRWGKTTVCVTKDDGFWHLSISCANRYPSWDEIHAAWYDLVPGAEGEITGAILLPRKADYVNLHPNCFHVHQLAEEEIPNKRVIL